MRKKAFTLIELMIIVAIIAMLVALVSVNFQLAQASSRDANRRESLNGYRTSLEQYYASYKTYLVGFGVKSDGTFDAGVCNYGTPNSKDSTSNLYINNFGPINNNNCVGYKGQSWGRFTRKNVLDFQTSDDTTMPKYVDNYKNSSIADVLLKKGFLSSIKTDPKAKEFFSDNVTGITANGWDDFVLAVCDNNGVQAIDPNKAKNYAFYAKLERPNTRDKKVASQSCGQYDNGVSGREAWNLMEGSGDPLSAPIKSEINSTLNYVTGGVTY